MTKEQMHKGFQCLAAMAGDAKVWSPEWEVAFCKIFTLANESAVLADVAKMENDANAKALAEAKAKVAELEGKR